MLSWSTFGTALGSPAELMSSFDRPSLRFTESSLESLLVCPVCRGQLALDPDGGRLHELSHGVRSL